MSGLLLSSCRVYRAQKKYYLEFLAGAQADEKGFGKTNIPAPGLRKSARDPPDKSSGLSVTWVTAFVPSREYG